MPSNWKDCLISLYKQEHGRLINIAYRMTGDWEMSRDLVQETFLVAYTHQDELVSHPAPTAWLFLTLRNLIRHERRRLSFFDMISLDDVSELQANDSPASLQEMLPAKLPEKDREILIMRFERHMSHEEIANQMGISPGACRMRISRAVAKCGELLKKDGLTP